MLTFSENIHVNNINYESDFANDEFKNLSILGNICIYNLVVVIGYYLVQY